MDNAAQIDLRSFIAGLIGDLDALRAGEISNRDASARAFLAKQILRGVYYTIMAQKFLEGKAKMLPPQETKS